MEHSTYWDKSFRDILLWPVDSDSGWEELPNVEMGLFHVEAGLTREKADGAPGGGVFEGGGGVFNMSEVDRPKK